MSAHDYLTHLKATIVKFNAGYQLMTEAKAELDNVYRNFKLQTIETPEPVAPTAPAASGAAPALSIAFWKTAGLGATKLNGKIDGLDGYVIRLFESKNDKFILTGGVVAKENSGGSFTENSIAFVGVKQHADKLEVSLKFDAKDIWYNGDLVQVSKTNEKMPDLRAELHVSVASAPQANTLSLLESPAVQEAQAPVTEALGLVPEQGVDVARVANLPWDEAPATPTASELLNAPNPTALTEGAGQLPAWLQ
jgi:hypothetical protein